MPFTENIDKLKACLEEVDELQNKYNWSEAETISKAILPILKCLGYGGNDYAQEFSAGGGQVDIALLPHEKHMWFVEAKKWSVALQDKEIVQLLSYANSHGLSYAVLTNGQEWRVYDNRIQSQAEGKQILKFKLSDSDSVALLSLLAKDSMESGGLERHVAANSLKSRLQGDLTDAGSKLVSAISKCLKKDHGLNASNKSIANCFSSLLNKTTSYPGAPAAGQLKGTQNDNSLVPAKPALDLIITEPATPPPTKPSKYAQLGDPQVTSTIAELHKAKMRYSRPLSVEIRGSNHELKTWVAYLELVIGYLNLCQKLPPVPYLVSYHAEYPWLCSKSDPKVVQKRPGSNMKEVPGSGGELFFEASLSAEHVVKFTHDLWQLAGFPMDQLVITWIPGRTE